MGDSSDVRFGSLTDQRHQHNTGDIVKTLRNLLVALSLTTSLAASAQEPGKEQAFFQALDKKIPNEERAEWDANVAREGKDKLAKSYYVFGAGACRNMKQG